MLLETPLGNPVRLISGPGQKNDITHAQELIDWVRCHCHYRAQISLSASFNKLKRFRRVATRYDKLLLVNFMGFVKLAAIAIWLR